MNLKEKIKKELIKSIKKEYSLDFKDSLIIENPPNIEWGDFAFGCFPLAKTLKDSPPNIARKLAASLSASNLFTKTGAVGPYVNFTVNNSILFSSTGGNIKITPAKRQKIMVEYLSPNTNKPLHIGHLRNAALGLSLSRILKVMGNNVIQATLINDRGIHICKSMLMWQKKGNGHTPEKLNAKPDHFVGDYYALFAKESEENKELEKEAAVMLQKWEKGDKETINLWKKMNGWCYAGWKETFKDLGLNFDKYFYESKTYKLGKDIILKGLAKKIFYKDSEGKILYDLPEQEFGLEKDGQKKKLTLLRPNGTSVYITQDMGTAYDRAKNFKLDSITYVVGNEQEYHFKCLFEILKALGFKWAKNLYHLSYGYVSLPEGRMSSRKGIVLTADDVINEVDKLAEEEIIKRYPSGQLSQKEIKSRAKKIAMAAIKFSILRITASQDIVFNPKESVSFEGMTGPYCQYAYARTQGIIKKAGKINSRKINFAALGGNFEERLLAQNILDLPDKISSAAKEFNPAILANQVYNIAKSFNQFYNTHHVLNIEDKTLETARLALVKSTGIAIKHGLNLLGIEVMEEM